MGHQPDPALFKSEEGRGCRGSPRSDIVGLVSEGEERQRKSGRVRKVVRRRAYLETRWKPPGFDVRKRTTISIRYDGGDETREE